MMSKPVAIFSRYVMISLGMYAKLHFMLVYVTLMLIRAICVQALGKTPLLASGFVIMYCKSLKNISRGLDHIVLDVV